jgi:hypothetical protein
MRSLADRRSTGPGAANKPLLKRGLAAPAQLTLGSRRKSIVSSVFSQETLNSCGSMKADATIIKHLIPTSLNPGGGLMGRTAV